MQLAAIAIPFLLAVAFAPHVSFYYDVTPKVVVLFAGAAAALLLAFFRLDFAARLAGTKPGRWFMAAAGASVLISIAAAPLAVHPALAWNGSNWRRYGSLTECAAIAAAVLIAVHAAGRADRRRLIQRAICSAGLLTSLYGIAQYSGWDPLLPHSAYEAGEGWFRIVRPPSTLGHADYFAAFLLWPVLIGFSAPREEPQRGWKLLARASSAAGMAAILLSGSRGALLALLLGLSVVGALLRPRLRSLAAGVAAAVVAVALFYFSPAGERLRARLHWIGEDRAGGARLLLWRDTLRMAATRPIAGFGPDNFVAEFPRFQSVDLAQSYPDFFQESPHNMLLDALAAEGVPGLLALLAVIAAALAGGLRAAPASAGWLAGFSATLVAHQFVVFTAPTAFYFYLGAGLLAGLGARPGKPLPGWSALRWAALPPALLFAALGWRLLAADAALARVQHRLDAGDPRGAAQAYRSALKRASSAGVTADLYFSRRWAGLALKTSDIPSRLYYSQIAAGAASLAARTPEQQQNGYYNLAMFLASAQDSAGVERALRGAIQAAPNWYKPHWALARLLANTGRTEESAEHARAALKLNAGKDPEVAQTLGPEAGLVRRSAGQDQ